MDSSSDESPMVVRKRRPQERAAVLLSDSEDDNQNNDASASSGKRSDAESDHVDDDASKSSVDQDHSDDESDGDEDEEVLDPDRTTATSNASNFLDHSAAEVSAIVSSSADATHIDDDERVSDDNDDADVSRANVRASNAKSSSSSIAIEASEVEEDNNDAEVSRLLSEADSSSSSIAIEASEGEDDDDANEDARIEAQCFSPRSRQSMGIGRQDRLTDSEDSDDNDEDCDSDVDASGRATLNGSSVEVPESDDDNEDEDKWPSPITHMNSTANQSARSGGAAAGAALLDAAAENRSLVDMTRRSVDDVSHNSSDLEVIPNERDGTVVLSSEDDDPSEIVSTPPRPQRDTKPLIQSKITTFTPKASAKKPLQQLKYVAAAYMSEQQKKRWDLAAQLTKNRQLLGTLSNTLPDGGAGLRLRLQRLEDELAAHDRYIETLRVDEERSKLPAAAAPKSEAEDWSKISAAINAIQPVHMGAQGLSTFNTQKALTVDRLRQLHASLETCPAEDQLAPTPKGLRVELMEHQRYALSWMAWRERQKPRGGILADDMGLGKTLTMISLVLAMNQKENDENEENEEESSDSEPDNDDDDGDGRRRKSLHHGGTLVVCPASLINQWEGEVNNRLRRNQLNVIVHHGNKRDVRAKYLARNDIVITTYAIVSREHKDHGALFGIRWARIILDEAHVIRNHKAKQSEACCRLSGARRWALTGTPIQNKEMDIYAQLRFLRCTPFDDLAVYKKWIGNQSTGNQERMNNIIRPMMLRRTKAQLQEKGSLQGMPEKRVQTVFVTLDKNEMNVYQRILTFSKTLFSQFLHQRSERQNDHAFVAEGSRPVWEQRYQPNEAYDRMHQRVKRMHGQQDIKSHQILTYILRLRQICCHPGLIDTMLEDADGEANSSQSDRSGSLPEVDLLEQLNKMNLNDSGGADGGANDSQAIEEGGNSTMNSSEHRAISKASSKLLLRSNPVFNTHRASSKFRKALQLITDDILPAGDKVVVVSQWTSVLNLFREHLDAAGLKYVRLTGEIAVKDRNELVVDFNSRSSGVRLMLLSLAAGGVGLNLIGGNHLMLLDPHWNPQLEAQAQDRVFRVGQTKPVTIYKFLCSDTIEERITRMQEKKLSIASDMLNGVKHTGGSKLTIDDMRALFDM